MKKIILINLIAVFLLAACQPEISDETQVQITPGTLNDFFSQNRSATEVHTVTGSSPGQVVTSKGTKIYFPANSFVDENNNAVTGIIKVEIKEINTPQEMILNDMPSVSGNRLLESGGEYNIKVSQNNRKLKLAPGNFLKIRIPETGVSMNGMQVFNGVSDSGGNINWVPNNNSGNLVIRDSSSLYSELWCDSVNWINCDQFINDPTVEYSVYPGNAPSPDSTNVFIHLTGRNSVVKMNWTHGVSYFHSRTVLAAPSTIIGISKKQGQLYLSTKAINIQNGHSVILSFAPCTEQELKEKLALLR